MTEQVAVPHVYEAMCEVTESLCKVGIGKNQRNQALGYAYRGIDDIYNALTPARAKARLVMTPHVLHWEVHERVGKSGGLMFHTRAVILFEFTSARDGSKTYASVLSEAMDSSDKSAFKQSSQAVKYASITVFGIPIVGADDADNDSPEAVAAPKPEAKPAPKPEATPAPTAEPLTTATKREIADLAKVLGWDANKTTEVVRDLLKVEKRDLTELQAQTLLGAMKAEIEKRLAAEAARAKASQ